MTQIPLENKEMIAVTVIEAGPCFVTQIKKGESDGYNAVQLGFGKAKHLNAPQKGHLKGIEQVRHLHEFRTDDTVSAKHGDKINIDFLKPGDLIKVSGLSKGKGFAGVVKRHHFAGGPKTHGQSDRHRHAGSIGAGASPGRVLKGTRMAGHMGNEKVTVRHLEVFEADPARNLLLVKGAVSGGRNGLLLIKKSSRGK